MDRRTFLSAAGALPIAGLVSSAVADDTFQPTRSDATFTAGSGPGPIFIGSPVICGPAADAITILQPISRHATGWLEYAVENGPFQRVDNLAGGLMPLESHVLKFRLPFLPAGKKIRYRITARTIGWVQVREFYHGQVMPGEPQTTPEYSFKTISARAEETRFVVWNDTHENSETLHALHKLTAEAQPDFLLWNGDQSNDIHFEEKMAGQYLMPEGLAIADRWPLAYVRGNHDVRGPAARLLPKFTGAPDDRYYYSFRSGPVAAIVLDTGEDKPDTSEWLGGLTNFEAMRREQTAWLRATVRETWFQTAPFRVMFCHIPFWFRNVDLDKWVGVCSKPCRDAWTSILQEAGVHVVISGHTHDHAWMPAKENQPLNQLIGGGPKPQHATIICGEATSNQLRLTMKKLDGKVVADVKLKA
jgi:predicted phosphodiesterase